MGRFTNKKITPVGSRSVITDVDTATNYEGGRGVTRDAKSELFLLAASFMGGDDNFYEKSDDRYTRLIELVASNGVITDPVWIREFVRWLRHEANMRTVAMVISIEAVRVRVANGMTEPFEDGTGRHPFTNRDIVNVALNRGDEPAEALAYWLVKHGKPIIQPVKNGIADAGIRLYNEYNFLKYGKSRSAMVGMIDVLRMTHPTPKDEKQNALFNLIVGKSESDGYDSKTLPMIQTRHWLYSIPTDQRQSYIDGDSNSELAFKNAGMTWENLSEWLPNGMDAKGWELAIPNMGIMALIRNLRNFDQAGISDNWVQYVANKITNAEEVKRSRQFPFRWYNAYRATESLTWGSSLETALDYSLSNIPTFRGKTLVLVDMSGSMFGGRVSPKSNVTYADAAALFGATLKLRDPDNVDLFQYGSEFRDLVGRYMDHFRNPFSEYGEGKRWAGVTQEIQLSRGGSVLRSMDKFHEMGGTETHKAFVELGLNDGLSKYNRIILLTDEQSFGWSSHNIDHDALPLPTGTTLYVWNLAGYKVGTSASGRYNRHTFGGLGDSAFKLIPILEAGKNSSWPWEVEQVPVNLSSKSRSSGRFTNGVTKTPYKPVS